MFIIIPFATFTCVFGTLYYLRSLPEPEQPEIVADYIGKLIDFKPDIYGSPGYLIFEDGRVFKYTNLDIDVSEYKLGYMYKVYLLNGYVVNMEKL